MTTVLVHRYRVYDVTKDDCVVSTRMATEDKIAKIGGEIILNTGFGIEPHLLSDGWTEKNFEPVIHLAQELEKRLTSN